jgi:hypothetical protein
MTEKQIFIALAGGIVSAVVGGLLLIISIQLIWVASGRHVDGGDDGWGFLWIALSLLSGVFGLVLSYKWARKRYPSTVP